MRNPLTLRSNFLEPNSEVLQTLNTSSTDSKKSLLKLDYPKKSADPNEYHLNKKTNSLKLVFFILADMFIMRPPQSTLGLEPGTIVLLFSIFLNKIVPAPIILLSPISTPGMVALLVPKRFPLPSLVFPERATCGLMKLKSPT